MKSNVKYSEVKEILFGDIERESFIEESDLAFDVSEMVVDARIFSRLTQEELAQRLGTKQPSIARLENGKKLPSLSFLLEVAKALGTRLISPKFELVERIRENYFGDLESGHTATLTSLDEKSSFNVDEYSINMGLISAEARCYLGVNVGKITEDFKGERNFVC